MATKKKSPAKKAAPKAVKKPAVKAATRPATRPAAATSTAVKSRKAPTPKWVGQAVQYAEKHPAQAVVGVIIVILFLLMIFG